MRDGRCCSTGMPENVNFAESSTIAPSTAASVSSGTFAAPFAEKLPTTAAGRDIAADALDGQLLAVQRRVDVEVLHRGRPRRPSRTCRS